MKTFIFILFLMLIFSCNGVEREDISNLYFADPTKDLEEDIKAGSLKFKGVAGLRTYYPLADECLLEEFGGEVLSRTAEVLESYEQQKLQAIAVVYAENYNLELSVYIETNNLSIKCKSEQ